MFIEDGEVRIAEEGDEGVWWDCVPLLGIIFAERVMCG